MKYHVSSASTLVTCRRRDYHDHFEFLTTTALLLAQPVLRLCDLFQLGYNRVAAYRRISCALSFSPCSLDRLYTLRPELRQRGE
jgi:hypothetical protein